MGLGLAMVVVGIVFGAMALGTVALIAVMVATQLRRTPTAPGWVAAPGHPAGVGAWHAQIHAPGPFGAVAGALGSTFGELRLADGVLAFVPTGATQPQWVVPCAELTVSRRDVLALGGADLVLAGPMGELPVTVSQEHINRLADNGFKALREREYAAGFVNALHAHGARIGTIR